MFIERFYRRMNEAGGLGDDTGGAGGGEGGEGTPRNDNTGDGGNGGDPGTEYVGPEWAKDWEGLNDLGADVLGDPSLKVFNSPAALLKSYVHAQKQLGKKGVMIPGENSTKEEWDQFYQKVGVPLEEQQYFEKAKLPEDKSLGEEFGKEFLKTAHELRVQPGQAAKLYEFFSTKAQASAETFQKEMAEKTQAELNALRDEWGTDAYGVKLSKAQLFLKETVGEDFVKYLGESGLGKNAQIVKAFATMAEKYLGEDDIPKGDPAQGMTINDLEREINKAYSDPVYLNPQHPDHKRRVDEVQSYFKRLDKARTRQ